MMLKDSPYSDAKSLLVTFSEVSVHRDDASDEAWTKLTFADNAVTRTCDLKKLQSAQDILGAGSLATGHYTQVRLTVASAALYFDKAAEGNPCAPSIATPDGRSAPLVIPSGQVKLNLGFDVKEGGATMMLLDFDGDKSVHETGNGRFMMSPVIAVASVQ